MKEKTYELDLAALARCLLRRSWILLAAAVLGGALVYLGSALLLNPQYSTGVTFCIRSNGKAETITSADLTASRNLVSSCIVILNTRQTMEAVAEQSGSGQPWETLRPMVKATALENTELFRVEITGPDPETVGNLAFAMEEILPGRISSVLKGTLVTVADTPVTPTSPSGPDYPFLALLGSLTGILLSAVCLVCIAIRDEKILRLQ